MRRSRRSAQVPPIAGGESEARRPDFNVHFVDFAGFQLLRFVVRVPGLPFGGAHGPVAFRHALCAAHREGGSSTRIPVLAITCFALARSDLRKSANSAGELPTASKACTFRNCSSKRGLRSALTNSALRRSTTGRGVRAGAKTPNQFCSRGSDPCSASVDTSGR